METRIGETTLILEKGDITKVETEAIVNAANSTLLGGGGVDGAIHRAGGPTILEECRKVRHEHGQVAAGDAVVTGAGELNAKWVVHAVGPVWHDGTRGENVLLERVYIRALTRAAEAGARRVALPSISTGAYRFPVDRASYIAVGSVARFIQENPEKLDEVRLVLFDDETFKAYEEAADQVVRTMLG